MTLLVGTVLARGRRTVTAALRQMGQEMNAQFSVFHHVLVGTFVHAGGRVEIVIDETLERRWGCTPLCAPPSTQATSDGPSTGGGPAAAQVEYGVARPENDLGNPHRHLVY